MSGSGCAVTLLMGACAFLLGASLGFALAGSSLAAPFAVSAAVCGMASFALALAASGAKDGDKEE